MEVKEKQEILALLEEGRKASLNALDGVSEEQAMHSPGPQKWSILGCVEHMAMAEDYLFAQIGAAVPSPEPVINLEREARMLARGTDRSRQVAAPEGAEPKGAFPTLRAAQDHFLESRKRTMEFVEANQEDLRAKTTWHPILGTANSHEMLLSIAVHSLRHVKQIEEIKAAGI